MTTMEKTIQEVIQEGLEAEKNQTYKGYVVEDIRKTFDSICPKDDWRGPIQAWIPHRLFGVAAVAVEFFTCTELKVVGGPQPLTGKILVAADGYRVGPAGDH